MEIKIKMKSTLEGEKGCFTKEEVAVVVKEILDKYGVNEGYSIGKETFNQIIIDEIANEFANRIPREYGQDLNRMIAGLMGATCYMPETFEILNKKPDENILRIASQVLNNRHHSTYGHSFLTLEISNIPKALAMVLNNEKDYNTSEKSARYTRMHDIEPKQNALYNKWLEIFEEEIKKAYPNGSNPFFDEGGKKARKLAQENARYMISVFNPTNMVYTTNFRQLNYIAHWFEEQIANPENNFYKELIPSMQEFVAWTKENDIYMDKLEDGKQRELSLFGDPMLKTEYSSSYQTTYKMSFACLAQEQRHRTISYNIDKLKFVNDFEKNKEFYIPPILKRNPKLVEEYLKDISSVAECLPQGTLLTVGERGTMENFILKSQERLCACAQKEIRDITINQAGCYLKALKKDSKDEKLDDGQKVTYKKYIDKFSKITKGSRCMSGYECTSPCGFKDGVLLESDI